MAVEETRKHDFPSVNPWDVLIWKLDSLERYIQREIGDIRREIGELREELREEIRGTRRSFAILEVTAVLGFIATIIAIFAARM